MWACRGLLEGAALLALTTGMGPRAAGRAQGLLEGRRLSAVICLGTCGALEPNLSRGELIMAEAVVGEGDRDESFACDGHLLELAAASGVALRRVGALLCARRVASEPALKRELAARYGAAAVDMESAALAACARRLGVPFLALKVVSDEAAGWMLPLDLAGWLAEPLGRTLRLPRYLGGLLGTALGWGEIRRGLEGAARVVAALGR